MQINNGHLLEGVPFQEAHDHGGAITPEYIVIHYAAGGSAESTAEWLTRRDANYVSAHMVVARNGNLTQLLAFNIKAFHAGICDWEGPSDMNSRSIGIEFANWGLLEGDPALGGLRTWANQVFAVSDAEYHKHKNRRDSGWWEKFPPDQLSVGLTLCKVLVKHYSTIHQVVGHDDIASSRKIDPGPAFPDMNLFNSTALGMTVAPLQESRRDAIMQDIGRVLDRHEV